MEFQSLISLGRGLKSALLNWGVGGFGVLGFIASYFPGPKSPSLQNSFKDPQNWILLPPYLLAWPLMGIQAEMVGKDSLLSVGALRVIGEGDQICCYGGLFLAEL